MKALMIPFAGLFVLAACAPDMTVEERGAAALAVIQSYNAAGVDPISLSDDELAILNASCATLPILRPDLIAEAKAVCDAAREAAK